MCGTHQEITARKLAEEKIRHLANHDVLTDMPSLRLAKDRLHMALSAARRNQTLTAVLFIDLDGFKQINDSLGHEAGDCVLREVAARLGACGRESDTVARIGGDEFLGVAGGLNSASDAAHLAERMLASLNQPMACGPAQTTVGASIGIALYPSHASTAEELIRLADQAMYRIKAAGKNAYGFAD
jgi:diguanylate cyclase (GGDEF)-like protein